jgi:mannose-6-phosphate isomerase-like protein (cupin superfamily)
MTATTRAVPQGEAFDLSTETVGLDRQTGKAVLMAKTNGPPLRLDGYTVGAPMMTRPAPHAGELHPDADELLYLISGSIQVLLELPDGDRVVDVAPGQAVIVPRGVWHRVMLNEPSHMIHVTPGPGGDHRPLKSQT